MLPVQRHFGALVLCLLMGASPSAADPQPSVGCCLDFREFQTCLNDVGLICFEDGTECVYLVQCTRFEPAAAVCLEGQSTFDLCDELGWTSLTCDAHFCAFPGPHCASEPAVTNHPSCAPSFPIPPPYHCSGPPVWNPGEGVCTLSETSPWCGNCNTASLHARESTGGDECCVST